MAQVNAKIGKYLGLNMWNKTSAAGTTIKDALDMAMSVTLNATDGDGPIWELYPAIAAVGAAYGDPDNKYASFLANADNQYPAQPYFLFNQVSEFIFMLTKPESDENAEFLRLWLECN